MSEQQGSLSKLLRFAPEESVSLSRLSLQRCGLALQLSIYRVEVMLLGDMRSLRCEALFGPAGKGTV